jgi:RsiW-degrading membrane proteinase PrsW (M82 family)
MQQSTQSPPPSPPSQKRLSGFHGPETNFFAGIRSQFATLERSSKPLVAKSPTRGFIVALVFAALASMGLSFIVELPFLVLAGPILTVAVFAPLLEEPFKALAMVIVVFFMWKTFPNRRYGAALGAAAGLGFGISESIIYIAGTPTVETFLTRVIVTFMHPLWSAFIGLALFAMVSGKTVPMGSRNPSGFLMVVLFLTGLANHIIWNSLAVGLGFLGFLLDVFVIFPLFAIILRDFLGGHFNFQNFLEPLETPLAYPEVPPPPPPPPPSPQQSTVL